MIKFLVCIAAALALAGCATPQISTSARYTSGYIPVAPHSFRVEPLDRAKEGTWEANLLKAAISDTLMAKGHKAASDKPPRLLYLFGYAVESGVESSHEMFFVLLAYDSVTRKQVFASRAKFNAQDGDVVKVGTFLMPLLLDGDPTGRPTTQPIKFSVR
jgi:hypothetical protein